MLWVRARRREAAVERWHSHRFDVIPLLFLSQFDYLTHRFQTPQRLDGMMCVWPGLVKPTATGQFIRLYYVPSNGCISATHLIWCIAWCIDRWYSWCVSTPMMAIAKGRWVKATVSIWIWSIAFKMKLVECDQLLSIRHFISFLMCVCFRMFLFLLLLFGSADGQTGRWIEW